MRALQQLYQQDPIAAAVVGVVLVVIVSAVVLWLLDLRGNAGWKPDLEYKPPQFKDRERDCE
ncbi:MAG: hypothetical protein AB7P40_10855 [Chloroflexota bacterium]